MQVRQVITGEIEENCYIVIDEETKKAFLVDPGDEAGKIIATLESLDVNLEYILLTHGHFDHLGAVEEIADKYNVPFYMSKVDEEYQEKLPQLFPKVRKADKYLLDGDIIKLGKHDVKVIATPGHTEGGLSFLIDEYLFTGDTLFRTNVGRTDFPGGDFNKIIDSIKKLVKLDDNTIVCPGHGPSSTIGYEKERNPYLS